MNPTIRSLVAGTALALVASGALAADAIDIVPAPVEPTIAPPAPYSWSGFYAGVEAGYAFTDIQNVSVDALGDPITGATRDGLLSQELDGFVVGGFAGANAQFGSFVLGVDGSVSYANLDTGASVTEAGFTNTLDVEIDTLANARVRAGYAFGRVLPYVTAGAAFASVDANYTSTFFDAVEFDDTLTGYTLGAGVDVAFGERAFARLDYAYASFDERFDVLNEQTFSTEFEDLHTVKLGVALKF